MKKMLASNLPIRLLLIGGVSIILIQLYVNQRFARLPVSKQFIAQSLKPPVDGFFQNHKPTLDQLRQVNFPFTFYVDAPAQAEKVFLELAYLCEPACMQIWLEVAQNPPQRLLIDHPGLRQLAWFFMSNGQQQFYQRDSLFPNPKAYLGSNASGLLLTDRSFVAELSRLGKQPLLLEDVNQIPPEAKYVLTTYQFPKHKGNWHLARKIDISAATRNQQGLLEFTLIHHSPEGTPAATLYLSQPSVHY